MSSNVPVVSLPPRERDGSGWRKGKPAEDPEKLKPWGFVTAKPSEYLVHVRRGQLLERSSGQGASCFKWPWDAVAVVPTSLQQLSFTADQVTSEKVGVEVSGFAVYRIADPLLAYRLLNFSYPERAQEKLEATLTEMFVGGARRLIANLTVEECLTKRKSALGEELLREVAPVVGGRGSPHDSTTQGWGVVIDTIEIQEVRVLSEKVFASMQAPFRSALTQRASEAKVQADQAIAAREAGARQAIEEAKVRAEMAIQARRREAQREADEAQAAAQASKSELEAGARQSEIAAQARVRQAEGAEAEAAAAAGAEERIRALQRARAEADTELEVHAARAEAATRGGELALAEAALRSELRRRSAEAEQAERRGQVELELARAEVEGRLADARARVLRAEKLPELAAAVGQRIGEVRISQFGGENPFSSITQAVAAVLDLVKEPAVLPKSNRE